MDLYRQIKKNFILPNAYEDWKEYRNALTQYIIQETNQVSLPLSFHANMTEDALLPSLAIIGAGACNDFDLSKLVEHFSRITLLDYDEEALGIAIDTYHLNECPYIECKTISLNGINDTHYEDFCNQLQAYLQHNLGNITASDFEDYAISLIERIFKQLKTYTIPLQQDTYDYICCFGVHSQLQAMFSYIYRAFEMNLKEMTFFDASAHNQRFTKRLQEENERFIPLFHDALLNCAKQGIFLGLEEKRTNTDGAIEGAYQGIQDIKKRDLKMEQASLVWPFLSSENINYEMSIMKISLNQ